MKLKQLLTKVGTVAVAGAALLAFMPEADARRGSGGIGSRGAKTYDAPPPTATAPKATAPIQKSITQPGATQAAGRSAAAPAAGAAQQASRFGGWQGLLLGGLFVGALASIFGVGALASVLGFVLQMLLIGAIVFLIFRLIQRLRGGQPAVATASPQPQPVSGQRPDDILRRSSMIGGAGAAATALPPLEIKPADYDAFERLLGEVQMAYGKNDIDALSTRLTPEMLSYFARELDENAKQGRRNVVSDVQLLQGDLAEAWREDHAEYATVAMRYALKDAMVEAATGKVLSGSLTDRIELTEVWTFVRPVGGSASQWELSAIQEAA